jgi:hypothetical protein
MPAASYKDRTVKLTLENTYFQQSQGMQVISNVASLYLPSSGIGGKLQRKLTPKGVITLVGPTAMSVELDANIGNESGVATTFLQPWQINNVPVKIKGESYLGAFDAVSVGDGDASGILNLFYTALRDFSSRLGPQGTKERVILEISNNPSGSSRFLGFIKNFTISEDVKKPYILEYELTFIGKNFDDMGISIGKQGAISDSRYSLGQ